MPLVATPVHFRRIDRGSGVRATVARLSNTGRAPLDVSVARVRGPFWVDAGFEKADGSVAPLAPGVAFSLAPGAETELAVRLDTSHPEFPTSRTTEEVLVELASGDAVALRVFLDEVVSDKPPYPGVVAIDFGTTSTCYAWKDDDSFDAPRSSSEIPSVIFFEDLEDPERPRVTIGAEAEHDKATRTHLVSSSISSIKRMLGGPPVRVIDPRGATAWYTPERIAGFFLREVLAKAQRDVKAKIARVVATYPPSEDERTIAALRVSLEHALGKSLAEQPGAITLRLDEVSAAACDHVLGRLHQTFRELKLERRSLRILAIDVGGGTQDAVALDVDLERRPRDATRISLRLLGATGDRRFGGEEVTRALVDILQRKLALAVQAARAPSSVPEPGVPGAPATPLADILRALSSRPQADDDDDDEPRSSSARRRRPSPLASTLADLAMGEGAPAVVAPGKGPAPGLERFACKDTDAFRRALARIAGATFALVRACQEGVSLAVALGPDRASEATALEDALDVVVPVRPERRPEPRDPARTDIEEALRGELFQEAERLKRRLSEHAGEALAPSGELERIARHADVDPQLFAKTVKVTLDEVEAAVYPRIVAFVTRARGLLDRLEPLGPATSVSVVASGVEVDVDREALRRRRPSPGDGALLEGARPHVLLCGNGSRLPAVRRALREVLSIGPEELAWSPERAKPMVAQGACEEEAQRRHFGGEFLEVELDGFAERLPYSIGLYHPLVEEAPGFRGGFYELFHRGARPGERRELGAENPLVHLSLERLKVYASDLDGAPPRLLGRVDLASEPVARVEPEPADDGSLRLRFELGANREVRVTDLTRGTVHAVVAASDG